MQVTLLGVSKMIDKCIRGRRQQSKLNPRAHYACFEEYHFQPMVVTTQPYEPLSHATLEWLKENQDKCDVLQVCHWVPGHLYITQDILHAARLTASLTQIAALLGTKCA